MKPRMISLGAILIALFCFAATEIAGQSLQRQRRQPERIARQSGNKLAPGAEAAADDPACNPQTSFAGISGTDPRDFNRRFFSPDERQMIIPGFSRPVVYLVILRQLNLTEQQKESIKALSQRVGLQLKSLRQQHVLLESQIEEAIYGETFDQKRVDELSGQSGQKLAEITKLQAGIEAEFRKILTPDQHYVFRYLIGQIMLLPQRRAPRQPRRGGGIDN